MSLMTERKSPASHLLWTPVARPGARWRLICFHHAGGHSRTFARWLRFLPHDFELVAVELPRESSLGVPDDHPSAGDMIDRIHRMIAAVIDRPFVLFGHSMGAMLAFYLALRLQASRGPRPDRLVVSAAAAPPLFDDPLRNRRPRLSDRELVEALARMGGTPPALLARQEFTRAMLPRVRADLHICATFRALPLEPLDAPVSILHGSADPLVPPVHMEGWRRYSGRGSRWTEIRGDHFYVLRDPGSVIAAILADLTAEALPASPSAWTPAGTGALSAAEDARIAAVDVDGR